MMKKLFLLALILLNCPTANAADYEFEKFSLYLQSSFEQLKYTDPEAAVAIRDKVQIPKDDIYYYPENFYAPIIANNGIIPLMMFNARFLTAKLDDSGLAQKLANLQNMKNKYNELRYQPDNFGPRYEAWTRTDPLFRQFSEEQRRALYTLGIFRNKFVEFKLDAPLIDTVNDVTAIKKTTGDCDTVSYLFTDFLIQATDTNGTRLFNPNQFGFDLLKMVMKDKSVQQHIRMRMNTQMGDVIIEATTGHISGVNGANDYKLDKKVEDMQYIRSFTLPEALGYNLFGEKLSGDKVFSNTSLTFIRSIYLISNQNDLLGKNFATQKEYQKNTAYNKVIEMLNKLVEDYNAQRPINENLYNDTYAHITQLGQVFGEDRKDVRMGYYGTLQQLSPEMYGRLVVGNNPANLNDPAAAQNTGAGI